MVEMTEKHEYDAALGGSVNLPLHLPTFHYTADRITEIKSLMTAIKNPSQTKLIFQTLPRHMRRRAMSHNPKRLPRKYRKGHIAQMRKSGPTNKTKRPSRKYRRKAANLKEEYKRRQARCRWLETHLWHAKRFHMCERWGYKLAESSCDKTFRFNYRATSEHCLLQDISYMVCLEVAGRLTEIRQAFSQLTDQSCGLGVCAKTYLTGNREGSVELFRQNAFPFGALGRVEFIWMPNGMNAINTDDNDVDVIRKLWLFIHPSFYSEVLSELINVMTLSRKNQITYINEKNQIQLCVYKNHFNRFRLTGPLSQSVLAKAFKCWQTKEIATVSILPESKPCWFNESTGNNTISPILDAHSEQSNYWDNIKMIRSPSELYPNMILALNIEDPRINRPSKRNKAKPTEITNLNHNHFISSVLSTVSQPSNVAYSALWYSELRDKITKDKITTRQYCELRNKFALIPGEPCSFENNIQPVPILLIQRPGNQDDHLKRLGYGGGWDILLPNGYGISTWMCLIMWGARAGGLRETDSIYREWGRDEFLPDTIPAAKKDLTKYVEQRNLYFTKPPNKRINYKKLAIASPFKCCWSQLIADWWPENTKNTSEFYVLRNKNHLQECQRFLTCQLLAKQLTINDKHKILIPIQLELDTRGSICSNSIICIPSRKDICQSLKLRKSFNNSPIYTESVHADTDQQERKQLRAQHIKLLKRLRRRRVRAKRRKQEHSELCVRIAKPGTAKLISEQLKKMRSLWLPDILTWAPVGDDESALTTTDYKKPVQLIRGQCERETIGYITNGDFSFIESKSAGIGYISLMGLIKLVKNWQKNSKGQQRPKCRVLVRKPNERHYRFANIKVQV